MAIIQREVRKRGAVGKIFKYLFIAFNILMLVWLVLAMKSMADLPTPDSEAGKAGAAIGGAMAVSMLLGLWAIGDIILGMLVAFTRGQRILITEDDQK